MAFARMPYADGMVQELLTAALPAATVRTQMIPDWQDHLPFIFVESVPGTSQVDTRFMYVVKIEITCYVSGFKHDSMRLAEDVRIALESASENQTPGTEGTIRLRDIPVIPYESRLDGQPSSVSRAFASYELGIRPLKQP